MEIGSGCTVISFERKNERSPRAVFLHGLQRLGKHTREMTLPHIQLHSPYPNGFSNVMIMIMGKY